MAEEKITYKKLPGMGMRRQGVGHVVGIRSRLYQGPDHLLSTDITMGFMESYKRFYYQDIQAFIIHKTWGWLVASSATGLTGAAFLFFMYLARKEPEALPWLGACAIFFLVITLWILALGPTCKTYIKTAAQTEYLPSLKRVKLARKVIKRLRPLIEQTQGTLTAEHIEAALYQPQSPVSQPVNKPRQRTLPEGKALSHLVCYLLLLCTTCLLFLKIWVMPVWLYFIIIVGSLVGIGFLIAALVHQHQSPHPSPLQTVTWITAGCSLISFALGYVDTLRYFLNAPSNANHRIEMIKAMARQYPFENLWTSCTYMYDIVYGVALGLAGLLITLRHRKSLGHVSSPSPAKATPPPLSLSRPDSSPEGTNLP